MGRWPSVAVLLYVSLVRKRNGGERRGKVNFDNSSENPHLAVLSCGLKPLIQNAFIGLFLLLHFDNTT